MPPFEPANPALPAFGQGMDTVLAPTRVLYHIVTLLVPGRGGLKKVPRGSRIQV